MKRRERKPRELRRDMRETQRKEIRRLKEARRAIKERRIKVSIITYFVCDIVEFGYNKVGYNKNCLCMGSWL